MVSGNSVSGLYVCNAQLVLKQKHWKNWAPNNLLNNQWLPKEKEG